MFSAGNVAATSISFAGAYSLSDTDSDGFSEQLSLGTGQIFVYDPLNDQLFSDAGAETVVFADFILDPTDFTSGQNYDFLTTTYTDGFKIFDDDNTLLFDADISIDSLVVDQSTGRINPAFAMNLSNIQAAADYIVGSSEIVDMFLEDTMGAANFTLQVFDSSLGFNIENGVGFSSTYSGNAIPMDPVPEPGTVFLLGSGVIGLVGWLRKKRR